MLEPEIPRAVRRLEQAGFVVSSLHLHPPAASPAIVHLHATKSGREEAIAGELREVLMTTGTPLPARPARAAVHDPLFERVRQALDREVRVVGDVLHVSLPSDAPASDSSAASRRGEVRLQPAGRDTVLATADLVLPDRHVAVVSEMLTGGGATVTGLFSDVTAGTERQYRLHAWMHERTDRAVSALQAVLRFIEGR
jgi:hypothetical protein